MDQLPPPSPKLLSINDQPWLTILEFINHDLEIMLKPMFFMPYTALGQAGSFLPVILPDLGLEIPPCMVFSFQKT